MSLPCTPKGILHWCGMNGHGTYLCMPFKCHHCVLWDLLGVNLAVVPETPKWTAPGDGGSSAKCLCLLSSIGWPSPHVEPAGKELAVPTMIAIKTDDPSIPVHLWNKCMLWYYSNSLHVDLSGVTWVLDCICLACLHSWHSCVWWDFITWLQDHEAWHKLLGFDWVCQWVWCAGRITIHYMLGASCWNWEAGSAPLFWWFSLCGKPTCMMAYALNSPAHLLPILLTAHFQGCGYVWPREVQESFGPTLGLHCTIGWHHVSPKIFWFPKDPPTSECSTMVPKVVSTMFCLCCGLL